MTSKSDVPGIASGISPRAFTFRGFGQPAGWISRATSTVNTATSQSENEVFPAGSVAVAAITLPSGHRENTREVGVARAIGHRIGGPEK